MNNDTQQPSSSPDPVVIGQKLQTLYPQYSKMDAAKLGGAYLNKYGNDISNVTSGMWKATDIPTKRQEAVTFGLNAIGYQPQTPKQQQDAIDAKNTADFSSGIVDQIYNSWQAMSPQEKAVIGAPVIGDVAKKLPFVAPNYSNMESLFYGNLLGGLRKTDIGGRITQTEISWLHDHLIPGPYDNSLTAQNKINSLKMAVTKKLIDPSFTINSKSVNGLTTKTSNSSQSSSGGIINQSDGTQWKQNSDGSYTRIK